ncbi:MAG: hypothetical protein ACNS60_16520 [Candidatus Cyclobacteriaceae bacterium M2_1C_046]
MKNLYFLLFLAITLSCNNNEKAAETLNKEYENPPAEGFNKEASDEKAIALADSVMQAMGGRKTYDTTRFIKWNFFGRRDLVWDRQTGLVRIESPGDSTIYLVNVKQDTGNVMIKGNEINEPDSLQNLISKAKSIWINDSYWLVMPFKLKDSGVTLKYLREDTTQTGEPAHVVQLTFDEVGDTPNNKYEVYIDEDENLVKQWAYFRDASQEEPSAVWPWDNYHEVGGLKLSYNRSDDKGPKDVRIYKDLPDSVFRSFATMEWDKYPDYQ